MNYGRNIIGSTGIPLHVSADGSPEWRQIGVTIDWTTVVAPGAPVVTPEQLTIPAGFKYLRFGQVVCMVTNQPVQTVTVTGTPTGGTFTLSGYRIDTGAYVTTAPIAYNATAAQVLAALQDPGVFGTETVATPITVAGSAGGPYTITSPIALLTANGAGLTGGTAPAVGAVLTTAVGNYGMFGPFDPAATDGRQTLNRGQCAILNTTTLQNGVLGWTNFATDHPGVVEGGKLWKARILATNGTHSLAAGPTYAELEEVLPRMSYAP
jgi:hypothetical protein